MKTYKIPVEYSMYSHVYVDANSPEEALAKAKEIEHQGEGFKLPDISESDYIDDSFQINDDIELVKTLNGE